MKLFFRFLLSLTVLLGGLNPSYAYKQAQPGFQPHKKSLEQASLHLADVYANKHLVVKYLPKRTEEKYSQIVARDNEDQQEDDEDHKAVSVKKSSAYNSYFNSAFYSQSTGFVCRHAKLYPPLCKSLAYSSYPRFLLLGIIRI